MHWVRNDSSFCEDDLGVFSFEPRESMVVEYRYQIECSGQACEPQCYRKLKTKSQWDSWLREVSHTQNDSFQMSLRRNGRQWHSIPDSSRQNGVAILFGARAEAGLWPGNIISELPVSREIFQDLVGTFHIHRSISRVINRNTTALMSSTTTRDLHTHDLQRGENSLPSRFCLMTTYIQYSFQVVPPTTDSPLLLITFYAVYNCRSASSWSDDIALSSTFYPSRNYTYCVVYGCSEQNRVLVMTTLQKCDLSTYHPLVLPLLFAEIERRRHFKMTDSLRNKLLTRALNISSNRYEPGGNCDRNGTKTTAADTDGTLRLWLEMSHLKNGLESWRKQLDKIIPHAESLSRGNLMPDEQVSRPSSQTTPVTTQLLIPDGFDKLKNLLLDEEDGETGEPVLRIRARLEEIREEYDEKIRSCGTIVDGMILATQMEWNEIGRGDTLTNLDIANATRNDGKQMRSIALLTMIFLPATSVATLFSMTFFNWSPDRGQSMMSPYIWLYATVTLVLTSITVGIWYNCNRPRVDENSAS